MFELPLKETLTLVIAAYAAVVATFVLGWDGLVVLLERVRWLPARGFRVEFFGDAEPQDLSQVVIEAACGAQHFRFGLRQHA